MRRFLGRLKKEERGATMVEYALMLGFIAAVCVAAVIALGVATDGAFLSVPRELAAGGG